MAMFTTTLAHTPLPRPALMARLSRWYAGFLYRASRQDRIDALSALSDAELAQMGIRRDSIAQYVWRDRMLA